MIIICTSGRFVLFEKNIWGSCWDEAICADEREHVVVLERDFVSDYPPSTSIQNKISCLLDTM